MLLSDVCSALVSFCVDGRGRKVGGASVDKVEHLGVRGRRLVVANRTHGSAGTRRFMERALAALS